MKPKPVNRILARYGTGKTVPTLWERPGHGIYLVHPDQPTTFIRICSIKDFQTNSHVLVSQGWILEN